MGVYKAEKSDAESVVLRHEGDDDHVIEIHAGLSGAAGSGPFAPVPEFFQNQVQEGGRYYLSMSFSKVAEPAPVVEEAPAEPGAAEASDAVAEPVEAAAADVTAAPAEVVAEPAAAEPDGGVL